MRIARKNLFAEKTRFAISVGGVAFAVFLILVLGSLYQGWMVKLAGYVESVEADLSAVCYLKGIRIKRSLG